MITKEAFEKRMRERMRVSEYPSYADRTPLHVSCHTCHAQSGQQCRWGCKPDEYHRSRILRGERITEVEYNNHLKALYREETELGIV